ncbi:hypothetical protein TanjilG_10628 [Lupinus angustifolius]|uniref:Uncharacterized protein n=1 Tax=Lupinus angustifolius TaxID=3871 RepID=A0A4P1RW07_LUPAN|nr:hypothetical protein TanjilG_10628 [Lupinus angustifolius]
MVWWFTVAFRLGVSFLTMITQNEATLKESPQFYLPELDTSDGISTGSLAFLLLGEKA